MAKFDRARLIEIATRHTRGPAPDRLEPGASPKCAWLLCTHTIDRSRPRTKHQRFCSPKCRKAAFDERLRTGSPKRTIEAV
jgi:hypothetical protein